MEIEWVRLRVSHQHLVDQGIVMKHMFYLRKYVLSPIKSCKGVDTGQLLLKGAKHCQILQLNKTLPIWTILKHKMDKPGGKKWSSPFYETNIPSQATVEERMKKQWKAFYLRFMLLPKMLLQATDCREYSCLEAIFCLGLAARELVLGPVVL